MARHRASKTMASESLAVFGELLHRFIARESGGQRLQTGSRDAVIASVTCFSICLKSQAEYLAA